MTKDKRTKAELMAALVEEFRSRQKAWAAVSDLKDELRQAKNGETRAESKAADLRKSLGEIRQAIRTAVAMKYPRTIAFGGVLPIVCEGQEIHPGYEGDNEEVRLLKLIDDKCQEALA